MIWTKMTWTKTMMTRLSDMVLVEMMSVEDAKALDGLMKSIEDVLPPVEVLDTLLDDVSDQLQRRNEIIERTPR